MRIGFLIYGDINTISGGYLYDRKVIEYLRNAGDDVTIISLNRKKYFHSIVSNLPTDFIKEHELDVIIEDELTYPSLYRTNEKLKKQIPIIALVHLFHSYSMQPGHINWLYKIIEGRYLNSIDGLILNSKSTLEQAESLMGKKLARHVIAYPAGDNFNQHQDMFNQPIAYDLNDPLKILFIGNVIKQKGLHNLLHALSMLNKNAFQLTITGNIDMEPEYVQSIRDLIKQYQLSDRVEFTGPLPIDVLPDIYRQHHVMALPSVNEAFGIVYLEAMQFGLPVIGTTAGGAKEIIQHGINGYLVDAGNTGMIAKYIKHWIETPDEISTMGKHAIQRYRQHPTWDITGNNIREFLMSYV